MLPALLNSQGTYLMDTSETLQFIFGFLQQNTLLREALCVIEDSGLSIWYIYVFSRGELG